MSDCRKCTRFEECTVDEDCGQFVDKPMTNADRIRSMSDEELASFLWQRDIQIVERASKCVQNIEDWLKSPAGVDNG